MKALVRVHLSSGQMVTAVWDCEPDQEVEDVEAAVLALLQDKPREFVPLGDIIVHTGAVSAVEVLG